MVVVVVLLLGGNLSTWTVLSTSSPTHTLPLSLTDRQPQSHESVDATLMGTTLPSTQQTLQTLTC